MMRNSIQPQAKLAYKFDLKGSWTNRFVNSPTCSLCKANLHLLAGKTLKDQDVVHIQRIHPQVINLSFTDRRRLLAALERDSLFLKDHNLMDYSLLLAVEKVPGHKVSEPASDFILDLGKELNKPSPC